MRFRKSNDTRDTIPGNRVVAEQLMTRNIHIKITHLTPTGCTKTGV